jgi:hypothetical protein
MKKILFLFLAFTAVSITSCSSDDDNAEVSIFGKWYNNREAETENGQIVWVAYQNECAGKRDYFEFLQNNILKDVYHSDFTNCEADEDLISWTRNGNTITVDGETGEIVLLNNTTLQVKFTDPEVSNLFYYVEFVR